MERGIALLSGGIDSPVAIHLLHDRLEIIAAHFHQHDLTGPEEVEKVRKLISALGIQKAYLVPFTTVLKALVEHCSHKNYYILQKIAMMKAAEMIAATEKATYLITGENLAQVSSQTLSNLASITKNISVQILRPLLTYDKQEIITVAKKIGTYDISKGPEVCSLLGPQHPATKSKSVEIAQELTKLDLHALLQKSIRQAELLQSAA